MILLQSATNTCDSCAPCMLSFVRGEGPPRYASTRGVACNSERHETFFLIHRTFCNQPIVVQLKVNTTAFTRVLLFRCTLKQGQYLTITQSDSDARSEGNVSCPGQAPHVRMQPPHTILSVNERGAGAARPAPLMERKERARRKETVRQHVRAECLLVMLFPGPGNSCPRQILGILLRDGG